MYYFRLCKCVYTGLMRISFQIFVYLVFCTTVRFVVLDTKDYSMEVVELGNNEECRKGAQYCHNLFYKAGEFLSCLLHVCV